MNNSLNTILRSRTRPVKEQLQVSSRDSYSTNHMPIHTAILMSTHKLSYSNTPT